VLSRVLMRALLPLSKAPPNESLLVVRQPFLRGTKYALFCVTATASHAALPQSACRHHHTAGPAVLGVWEPKVASGHGYTVSVPATAPPGSNITQPGDAGIPDVLDIGLTDARLASVPGSNPRQPNPFFVRMGICYGHKANGNGASLSASSFTVQRGYKSWGRRTRRSQEGRSGTPEILDQT